MKFDIITLTYNSEQTILDTLNSVKNQKKVFVRHIILDALSNDKTANIIKSYQNKNILFLKNKKGGVYKDLNKALKYCKNPIIGILHSDDTFYSSKTLEIIKDKFKTTKANVIYGDVVYVDRNSGKVIRNWIANSRKNSNELSVNLDYNKMLKYGWMAPHTSLFIKREHLKKIGKYNENYSISSDYDYIIRIFKNRHSKICYIPKVFVKMKLGGISNKSLKNLIIKSLEDLIIIKKNKIGGLLTVFLKIFSKIKQFF